MNILFSKGCVCDINPSLCGADHISDPRPDPEGLFEWSEVSLYARCMKQF